MSTEPARWQRQRAEELLAAGAALVAGPLRAHLPRGGASCRRLRGLRPRRRDRRLRGRRVLRNDLGLLAVWSPDGDWELELVGLRLHYAYTELAAAEDADWIATRLGRACAELGRARSSPRAVTQLFPMPRTAGSPMLGPCDIRTSYEAWKLGRPGVSNPSAPRRPHKPCSAPSAIACRQTPQAGLPSSCPSNFSRRFGPRGRRAPCQTRTIS